MNAESFDPPSLEVLEQLLPAYDLIAFIAQGGMGAVYKARQRSLDRDVAIKILPRELGADPEFRRSFETEAKAMARLNHPNLIGVYDFGDADGMPYIVMEYVPGKSLFHSAHNLAVDPRQAVTIVKAICDGLAHAHENGVIHRDIKPANILLTPKAEPKVGDFGLARPAGDGSTGLLMGTPGYTAAEVMREPDHADHRSDIFALGVVLYELLIGRCPPYDIPAPPPSSIVGCDTALDAICAIATHPSADMRYPSAGVMSAALDQWLRHADRVPPPRTTATIAHAPARPPRPVAGEAASMVVKSRGNSSLVVQAAVLAVLIVATAIAWKHLKGMEKERAAEEAAHHAKKGDPAAVAQPSPKPDPIAGNSKPEQKPHVPTPTPEDPVTPPEAGTEPEVAVTDDMPPDAGIPDTTPEETTEPDAPPAKPVELPAAIVELETKAKSLVTALETDRDKELAANAKTYGWELDSWVKTLSKTDQITWRPHVEQLKRLATNDRVPVRIDSDSGINVSERMSKIADFAARKQKTLDETFATKAGKIRDAYVTRVKEAAGKSQQEGAEDVAQALEAKAEAATDLDAWVMNLMGRTPVAPPAADSSIVGKWRSKTSSTVVTFAGDGTCKSSHGDKGQWTREILEGEQIRYVISWGTGYIDQLSPEKEGTVLAGQNNRGELVRLIRRPEKLVE
jgi:serine/threonine protein kinase